MDSGPEKSPTIWGRIENAYRGESPMARPQVVAVEDAVSLESKEAEMLRVAALRLKPLLRRRRDRLAKEYPLIIKDVRAPSIRITPKARVALGVRDAFDGANKLNP